MPGNLYRMLLANEDVMKRKKIAGSDSKSKILTMVFFDLKTLGMEDRDLLIAYLFLLVLSIRVIRSAADVKSESMRF